MDSRMPSSGPSERAESLSDFKQLALLGEGAYSAVYKVQRLADGETYALKKVKLPSLSDKEKQNALNEIRLLASVRHENVISYKEAFFDDKTRCLCIVTECADGGDLLQQIQKSQKEKSYLREVDLWRYYVGMCNGLQALHRMKILHRDLKCANIFLSTSPKGLIAKLGDFNVSTVAKRGLCMTQTGTPYYASPEVWRDMPYDGKSDIWSLGCVVYEACALRPPFQAKDMEGLYRRVLRGQYPYIPQHFTQDLSDVIAEMLQVNPRHRPSADQLLQVPVVRQKAMELGISLPPAVGGAEAGAGGGASDLLRTIKVPRNIIDLSAYLPLPQYDDCARKLISEASANPTPAASARRHHSHDAERSGGAGGGGDSLDAYIQKASVGAQALSQAIAAGNSGQHSQLLSKPPRHSREREHSEPPPSTGGGNRERDRADQRSERRAAAAAAILGGAEPGAERGRGGGSRLPRILSKASSRPSVGGGASAALPRLPRILSTPNRLPPVA